MGVLKLFGSILNSLAAEPHLATETSLDALASNYQNFSYIGNRKALEGFVLKQAGQIKARLDLLGKRELIRTQSEDPLLTRRIDLLRHKKIDPEDMAREWFGNDWKKNSGVFPDFVLGLEKKATFGNGSLLELKDSRAATIASFNSTIPTRLKSLSEAQALAGKTLVTNAAQLFEFPLSTIPGYMEQLRPCFYLVRTNADKYEKVRVSLVEGSFFETLPKDRLLQAVWGQLLDDGGADETERERIVEILGHLGQTEIAKSREIAGASVQPRLRLMAEVHPEGNIHRYSEIGSRTCNLVIKKEEGMDLAWVIREFKKEGISAGLKSPNSGPVVVLSNLQPEIRLSVRTLTHKRNGEHLVLQMKLDS